MSRRRYCETDGGTPCPADDCLCGPASPWLTVRKLELFVDPWVVQGDGVFMAFPTWRGAWEYAAYWAPQMAAGVGPVGELMCRPFGAPGDAAVLVVGVSGAVAGPGVP